MLIPLLLSLSALVSPASAATHEISVEAGWLGTADPAFSLFSDGAAIGSIGLRGGFKVHDHVAVIAGWQHATNGAQVSAPGGGLASGGGGDTTYYYGEDDYYYDEVSFRTALYTDQITLGSKADVKVFKWLHPYVAAQVIGMRALARVDDAAGDDENLTQVQRAGVTAGAMGTLGLDFPIGSGGAWAIAPYVELGYGWLAPVRLGELGNLHLSGFTGRAGVGVRF